MDGKTCCFCSDVSCYEDGGLFLEHLSLVPEPRKKKITELKLEKDKRQSLGVYVLFLRACAKLGLNPDGFFLNQSGKPCINGFFFSFSHSGSKVMVSVSDQETGCDVERFKEGDIPTTVHLLPEEEREQIRNRSDFTRIWTMKESYLKAIGTGITVPLTSFSVSLKGKELIRTDLEEGYRFRQWTEDGYCFCVASKSPAEPGLEHIVLN